MILDKKKPFSNIAHIIRDISNPEIINFLLWKC
jgi:hypothetical protein